MEKDVIRNALGGLERLLGRASRALKEIEYERFGGGDDLGSYESPSDAMFYELNRLYDHFLIILEAAEMEETRSDLISRWMSFKKAKGGLRKTVRFGDFDHLDSPALEYLTHLLSALQMSISNEITSKEAWTLQRLEDMLNDTDALVHRQLHPPENEMDLQKIMFDYLSACFPDFVKNPDIGGSVKNFTPDCGIKSVGAAIEFKIAHDREGAVEAFSGIAEDTAGYKNSKDWTRFYGVLYQAKPFLSRSQLKSDVDRIGAASWTLIVANGATGPRRKVRRSTTANRAPAT